MFRARTAAALAGDAWVVDGNYSGVRDIVWGRADTVVWLDYALPVILWRVVWRMLCRSLTREELWRGNRETLRAALFSRESITLWTLQTYRGRRRAPPILVEGDYTEAGGYGAMERFLPAGPTAVFAASDVMAVGAIKALAQTGLLLTFK